MADIQLDRQRAAGAQVFSASNISVGDEPLIVDLMLPGYAGQHWIVESLSLVAGLTTRTPALSGGFPPNSGLYLCPPNTPSETLAQAQAGINLDARPILLPMGPPGSAVGTVGAGAFAAGGTWALTLAHGFKITVPYLWFLRAIVVCAQGTATPGPGINSIGRFSALAYRESDNEPGAC
jgi:hypothetical protein